MSSPAIHPVCPSDRPTRHMDVLTRLLPSNKQARSTQSISQQVTPSCCQHMARPSVLVRRVFGLFPVGRPRRALLCPSAQSSGSVSGMEFLGHCWGVGLFVFSHAWLFETPWTIAYLASLSLTISQSLFKLMSTESVMPSNHLILCHPLVLPPSISPSIRVFSSESALRIRWPEYWSFSFNISPSNEHPGLISFRMDCLHLLVVQGTLKRLLQHHSYKTSILQLSAFFIVQFSHLYVWDVGRGGLTLSETAKLLFKVTVPTSNPTSSRQFQFPICAFSVLVVLMHVV